MVEEKKENPKKDIWNTVKKIAEGMIKDANDNLIIQTEILALANKKLEEIEKCQKK